MQNRAKSKSYPSISLPQAIGIIEKATKSGKTWTRSQFANFGTKVNANSSKSGAFIRRIAALKEYGLIETSHDVISLTSLGEKVVKPLHPEEKQEAIREAFYNTRIYSLMIDDLSFRPDTEFSQVDLATLAVNKHGITRDAQVRFVKSMVDSALFAEVFKNSQDGSYKLVSKNVPALSNRDIDEVVFDPISNMGDQTVVPSPSPEIPVTPSLVKPMSGIQQSVSDGGPDWLIDLKLVIPVTVSKDLRLKAIELVDDALVILNELKGGGDMS